MKFNKIIIITMSLLIVSFFGQQALAYGGPPQQSSTNNYTVELKYDKESYGLGDSVIFSGNVNKFDDGRNLRISIFDSNQNLVVTQKVSVNADTTFSHPIILNQKFLDGEYTVKSQYGSSKSTIEITSFLINSDNMGSLENKIPEWIKSNAGWWADGQIDDNSFVQGIQFLIKEGLMEIPASEQGAISQDNKIPEWIKSNAGWWADGQIDDNSFVQGIQFLIKEGLMQV